MPLLENLDLQVITLVSTKELVRMLASGMREGTTWISIKFFSICNVQVYIERNNLLSPAHFSGNPLPFLKCANGTPLPLALLGPSARMPTRENFYHFRQG